MIPGGLTPRDKVLDLGEKIYWYFNREPILYLGSYFPFFDIIGPKSTSEGKILVINKLYADNKLNTKKSWNLIKILKIVFRNLKSPMHLPPDAIFYVLASPIQRHFEWSL